MIVGLLAAAAMAQQQTVCPSDGSVVGCDFADLATALREGGGDLLLRAGPHVGGVGVSGTVTLRGEPGTRIVPAAPGWLLRAQLGPYDRLELVDLELDGANVAPLLRVYGGAVEVRGSVLRRGNVALSNSLSAGIEAWDSQVTVGDSEIVDNVGVVGGGVAIYAGSLSVVDSLLARNLAIDGGAIRAEIAQLDVSRSQLEDNVGWGEGGHLASYQSTVTITDSTLRRSRSSGRGLAVYGYQSELHLVRGAVDGSRTPGDPVLGQFTVYADGGGPLSVDGTVLQDNDAGAVGAFQVDQVDVSQVWACDHGGLRGAGVDLWASCAVGCAIVDSVLQGNEVVDLGGALKLWDVAGPVEIARNTVYANTAGPQGSGAALYVQAYGAIDLDAHHNLFAGNGGGGFVIDAPAPLPGLVDNAFGDNGPALSSFAIDETRNLMHQAPVFSDGPAPCGVDVHLQRVPENDPLLDGGYGAFPDDCGSDCVDHDGDGAARVDDCDDADGAIYPGAPDLPFDGVDQNCDGVDGFDGDRDGVPFRRDCDDADASILECVQGVAGGGGCDQRGGAPVGGGLVLLLLLRRR